jgi:2-phospho-L-lactate/phosphoenolpyruvate guanylyltransferase
MSPARSWSVVVPVKRTAVAKSRLTVPVPSFRPALALAFAADTLLAVRDCAVVQVLVVVTDDEAAAAAAREVGALVVGDEPDRGLNPALVHGARQARQAAPHAGVALLSADLPALRPHELARALQDAAQHPQAFVADVAGMGTTLLTAGPGAAVTPAFGPRSRARHRAAGVHEITRADIGSLRRDVDTEVDLWDAVRLGVGPTTRGVLAAMQDATGWTS